MFSAEEETMNSQNTTIVILLVTAAILSAVLVGIFAGSSETALAAPSVRGGDYSVCTGNQPGGEGDLLFVVNMEARQLNVYNMNVKTNAVDLIQKVDLDRAFRAK